MSNLFHSDTAIYVAGHRGLVGSALVRALQQQGCKNLLLRTHRELDLTDAHAVNQFFEMERPEVVFLAAAKVGGIHANNVYPADFIYQNLAIQTNVIHAAYQQGVRRLLFLGSSCIYPRVCPQPIKEEYLLTSALEPTNRPYAVAKIAGIEMCWAYNRQYDTQYLAVMPTNLYGKNDNYDLQNSHVVPALIRKLHMAKQNQQSTVELWGTGTPKREFLYVDDLADACLFLMQLPQEQQALLMPQDHPPIVNVGCGEDLSIQALATLIAGVVGYFGKIVWDHTKPDGTPRKLLDVYKINTLGWLPKVILEEGVRMTYQDFLAKGEL